MENNYYVYCYWRKDKMQVFYVGKGKGLRRFNTYRNPWFNNIIQKVDCFVTIYASNLTEQEAFDLEEDLIAQYKCIGWATTNIHKGGSGGDVYRYDNKGLKEKMKAKCRKASSGKNNPMFGKSYLDFMDKEKIKKLKKSQSKGQIKRFKNQNERNKIGKLSKQHWNKKGIKENYHINNSRRVHMYDENKNYEGTFISLEEALKYLNIKSHTTILKAISNNKKYKNHYWKREELKGVSTIENIIKSIEVE